LAAAVVMVSASVVSAVNFAVPFYPPVPGSDLLIYDGPGQSTAFAVPDPDPAYYGLASFNYSGFPPMFYTIHAINGATVDFYAGSSLGRNVIATDSPYYHNGQLMAFPGSKFRLTNLSFRGGEFITYGSGQIDISSTFGEPVFSSGAHPYPTSNFPRIDPKSLVVFNGTVNVTSGHIVLLGPAFIDGLTLGSGSAAGGLYLGKQPGAYLDINTQVTSPKSDVVTLCGPGSIFPDIDTTYKYVPVWKPGTLKLTDNDNNFVAPHYTPSKAATVYVAPNFTISGAGSLQLPGHIAGNIVANQSHNLHVILDAAHPTTIDPDGVLQSEAGSELDIRFSPGTFSGLTNWTTNAGNENTLSGGTYVAKGYTAFPETLDHNGASLDLYPTGHFIKYGQYSEDSIANLKSNFGTITFHDGVSEVVTSDLVNNGVVALSGDGNLITYGRTVSASYSQGVYSIAGNNNILTFDDTVTGQVIQVSGNNNQVIFKKTPTAAAPFVPISVGAGATFSFSLPGSGMNPGDALTGVNLGVSGGATIVIPNAKPFSTLGSTAKLTIDGAGTFTDGTSNLLQNFNTNQGSLVLSGGATIPSGSLNNQGAFYVPDNASLNSYMQTSPGATTTVDGTFTAGTVTILAGSLNGYFNIKGNVQIGSGALLDPGHSPTQATVDGNLSITAGSTTKMEIGFGTIDFGPPYGAFATNDPSASDSIHVTGDLTIEPGSVLDIVLLPWVDPYTGNVVDVPHSAGDTVTFFAVDGVITGSFGSVIEPANMTPGLTWEVRYTPHSVVAVAVAVVPEPAAVSLVLPAMLPLRRVRR
jgi:hypothetical protein